jgi:Transcriptional regulator, AbiEi antitoxin
MGPDTRTALAQLAESQCGLFSAAQAASIGLSSAQLSRAVRYGHLRKARFGVYAFVGAPGTTWEPLISAALAVGAEAAISHTGAAAIQGLSGVTPASLVPELTVPRRYRPRLAGVTIHRCVELSRHDVEVKCGVLVTSPARTLMDLASRYNLRVLGRMLDEALIARRLSVTGLKACLDRKPPNAPGRASLDELISARAEGPLADSMLEARAFEALRPLSPFKVHFPLGIGQAVYVIDAAWPSRRLGAEIVGRAHRVASRSAFDRERRKLNDLAAAGWRVAHLTSAMSADEMVEAVRKLF